MGNVVSEVWRRIKQTWRTELMFSALVISAVFIIDHSSNGAKHSVWVSLQAIALVLVLCAAWHLSRILLTIRIITGLHHGDPCIVAVFIDERKEVIAIQHSAALELKNKGLRDALWVRIQPIKLKKRTLYFGEAEDVIAPTDYRRFHAEVGGQWGYDSHNDLIRAMSEEWLSYPDFETRREITIPVQVQYSDINGTFYECIFEMTYHGGKGWNQPADVRCIECRNFMYRRIIAGGAIPINKDISNEA